MTVDDAITGEHIEDLTTEVENLRQEIRVLRDVMDEVREDLEWLVRNLRIADVPRPFRITSLPVDPTAKDFGQRINAVSENDRQRLHERPVLQLSETDEHDRDHPQDHDSCKQRALWNDDETNPQVSS